MIAAARYARERRLPQENRLITLRREAYPLALIHASRAGIAVTRGPDADTLRREVAAADVVNLHFWNSPRVYAFLRSELPARRLLVSVRVLGRSAPQVLTREVVELADGVVASSPATLDLPVLAPLLAEPGRPRLAHVYPVADVERFAGLSARSHDGFNVTYVGTVGFAKMHSAYARMSARVDVPGVRFLVCGGPPPEELLRQVRELSGQERFEFRGFVEDLRPVLEVSDVFGYPLRPDSYAAGETSLQEAMHAGVPPVVFAHQALERMVEDGRTGLVVRDEETYAQAIAGLHRDPDARARLSRNAREHARQAFDGATAAGRLHEVYESLAARPRSGRRWSGLPADAPPARRFVEALGGEAGAFAVSLDPPNDEARAAAEREIGGATPLLFSGEGGLAQYRNQYPDDGMLRLWTGLVLERRGERDRALAELRAARELGETPWAKGLFPRARFAVGKGDT